MTRTMLTTQLFAAAAMLLVTLPAAAQTFDAALEAYVRGDYATALAGFQNYAEQGYAAAQSILGHMYANGEGVPEDDAEAVRWYRLGAEQGNAAAQFLLGGMYANGEGLPKDNAEAVRWFRLAAEQGNAPAQFLLGGMYANGEGLPKDNAEAVRWYRLAAEQGYAAAQFNLGGMYANGEGLPKDNAEAVRWYRLAAEQGYALAQLNLGLMYANGEGVPENDATAYAWLNIAAAQGQSSANEGKEHVAKHMTQSQVAKAQKLSREYWTRYVIPFQIVPRTPKRRYQPGSGENPEFHRCLHTTDGTTAAARPALPRADPEAPPVSGQKNFYLQPETWLTVLVSEPTGAGVGCRLAGVYPRACGGPGVPAKYWPQYRLTRARNCRLSS